MKKIKKHLLTFVVISIVSACSNDTTTSISSQSSNRSINDSTDQLTKASNKFYDSSVKKLMAASPGMTEKQSSCIVDEMTKSGEVGLGEIVQMKLKGREMNDNASYLKEAYYQSMKICIPPP